MDYIAWSPAICGNYHVGGFVASRPKDATEHIVPLKQIEYGVYQDLFLQYTQSPRPYSIYLRETISLDFYGCMPQLRFARKPVVEARPIAWVHPTSL